MFASGLEATAIRPGNVFGPRDHTFIDKYAQALDQGKGGYIGGGRSWTCPAYVENLADAIALACFEPAAAGEAFLATDGLDIDWRTFTEKLADELGVERPRLSVPFWLGYPLAAVMEGAYKVVGAAEVATLDALSCLQRRPRLSLFDRQGAACAQVRAEGGPGRGAPPHRALVPR